MTPRILLQFPGGAQLVGEIILFWVLILFIHAIIFWLVGAVAIRSGRLHKSVDQVSADLDELQVVVKEHLAGAATSLSTIARLMQDQRGPTDAGATQPPQSPPRSPQSQPPDLGSETGPVDAPGPIGLTQVEEPKKKRRRFIGTVVWRKWS